MSVLVKSRTKSEEPEVLDPATLAAIDKADRWAPETKGFTFDEALERARASFAMLFGGNAQDMDTGSFTK